jgi:hypothetical protein
VFTPILSKLDFADHLGNSAFFMKEPKRAGGENIGAQV